MNIQSSIAEAACPESATVLGIRLRPFSTGHWLLLVRHDVSFVTGSFEHTLGDLLMAVMVCSSTWEDFTQQSRDGTVLRRIEALRRRLTGGRLTALVRGIRRLVGQTVTRDDILGFDLDSECERMATHVWDSLHPIEDWSRPTAIPNSEPRARTVRAPHPMQYLTATMAELHQPFSEIIDLPMTLLRWLVAVESERCDKCTLMDMDEAMEDKRAADEFAQKIEREGVNGDRN